MSVLAIVRPSAWEFLLFLHVLGAMVMVGALVLAASALMLAWRDGNLALVRLGYRVTLCDPFDGQGNGPTEFEACRRHYPQVTLVRAATAAHMAEEADLPPMIKRKRAGR